MEGKVTRRTLPAGPRETVTLSYADSARVLAPSLVRAFQQQGLDCHTAEKLRDPGERVDEAMQRRIDGSNVLCLVLSRRCRPDAWLQAEASRAAERGIPVLVFVEDLQIEWPHSAVPTLVTNDPARLAAFVANSQPQSATLWEFGRQFFIDRSTAALFRRHVDGSWRWERETPERQELSLEMAIVDDSKPAAPEVKLVQAKVENNCPVLLLGTTDWKRYRFAYSADVRAVLPAPVFPNTPVVGFMHADFDTGREWPRAGEAPVEIRLLGREVYGWHMSEYFWRAFVGSLPKMLGRSTVEPA